MPRFARKERKRGARGATYPRKPSGLVESSRSRMDVCSQDDRVCVTIDLVGALSAAMTSDTG